MQVDDAHIHYCASKQQQEPSQVIQQPAAGDGAGPVEATEIKQKQEKQADTAMQSEELLDGSFTSSKDASATTQTPKVSRISESELDALYASLDAAKKELAQTRQKERAHAAAVHELKAIERERDRYRAVSNIDLCHVMHRANPGTLWQIRCLHRLFSVLPIRTKCSMMS